VLGRGKRVNSLVAAGVGVVVAFVGVLGGTAAYTGSAKDGVSQSSLYDYGDN
jgi:hypothetical protein